MLTCCGGAEYYRLANNPAPGVWMDYVWSRWNGQVMLQVLHQAGQHRWVVVVLEQGLLKA